MSHSEGDGPRTIGRFRVLRTLGEGAQGRVYLARDPDLEREVAVKLLWTDALGAPGVRRGFPREGRVVGRLQHPNLVSVHEAGRHRGAPYLVFEYVQGRTLRQIIERSGAMPLAEAARIIEPVLDGIAHAHRQGVVHLDISPGNVLVDESGVPRVMDFGLARIAGSPSDTTEVPAGTLRYMSPEHFSDAPLGSFTDVFALASMCFELVAGVPAWPAQTPARVIRQILHQAPAWGRLGTEGASGAFAAFLRGGLDKDPKRRYANAAAMRRAFEPVLASIQAREASTGVGGAHHSTVEFLLRRMRRRQDFPALTATLAEINRMTRSQSPVSAQRLADVILRDYALTNKLLKLANSAFYGGDRGEVTSVSRAIGVLGVEQVRTAANSLAYFAHMQRGDPGPELREAMVRSFVAGLLARHLAERARFPDPEEAFICGMLQNLGEHLIAYYFPDEHAVITDHVAARSVGKQAVSRAVLGISYAALGAAVARVWKFPDGIVDTIAGHEERGSGEHGDGHPLPAPRSDAERVRDLAVFANAICDLVADPSVVGKERAMAATVARFRGSIALSAGRLPRLLAAATEKLGEYSPNLGFDVQESQFCRAVEAWVASQGGAPAMGGAPPGAGSARAAEGTRPAPARASCESTAQAVDLDTWHKVLGYWRRAERES